LLFVRERLPKGVKSPPHDNQLHKEVCGIASLKKYNAISREDACNFSVEMNRPDGM
jgi:hypothetical protein